MVKKVHIDDIWIILFLLFLITTVRLFKVTQDYYCLGWDCSNYIYQIKHTPITKIELEPLFYLVTKGMNLFLHEILVVKALQLILPVVTSLGIYLLMKDKFSIQAIIVSIILLNFLAGYNRIWTDMYRNLFLLAFIPYFLYFFLKENLPMSMLLLSIMILTHSTFFYMIPLILIYSLFKRSKENIKNTIIILTTSFLAFLPSLLKESSTYLFLTAYFLPYNPFETTAWFIYFSSFYPFLLPLILFKTNFKDKYHVIFLSFFFIVLLIPYIPFIREWNRSTQIMALPMALLMGMFYDGHKKVIETRKNVKVIFTVIIIFTVFGGVVYIYRLSPSLVEGEVAMYNWIADNTENDSIILVTSREKWFVEYITHRQTLKAEWFFIEAEREGYNISFEEYAEHYQDYLPNISLAYSGNKTETISVLNMIKKEYSKPTYMFWSYRMYVPYNNSKMMLKENYLNVVKKIGSVVLVKA